MPREEEQSSRSTRYYTTPFLGEGVMFPNTAAPPFSPTDIAGLTLWLKADAITGKVDNDPVTTWLDSSGNSRTATAGPNALTYKANQQNGKPAVRFMDPTLTFSSYATTPSITGIAAWTCFLVIKEFITSNNFVLDMGADTTSIISQFTAGKIEYFDTPRTVIGNCSTAVFQIITCPVGFTTTGVWTIGGASGGTVLSTALYAEIIAYNSVLSAGNITAVQGYLQTKYAL